MKNDRKWSKIITLVDITFDAYCLLSPTKIVSRFRKTQNWGWRRPPGALKNRNPTSAETSWGLNFASKTSPTNVKLDLSPFKVSCFHIFESPSHDPKYWKQHLESIQHSNVEGAYLFFSNHRQTHRLILKIFCPKVTFTSISCLCLSLSISDSESA